MKKRNKVFNKQNNVHQEITTLVEIAMSSEKTKEEFKEFIERKNHSLDFKKSKEPY